MFSFSSDFVHVNGSKRLKLAFNNLDLKILPMKTWTELSKRGVRNNLNNHIAV